LTGAPDATARTRWYGRRRGKRLRKGRQELFETLLPSLRLTLPVDPEAPVDPAALFAPAAVQDLWLEIGFGAGEHLAAQAERHREVGFIGCEAFISGIAGLLVRARERGLGNVRIFEDDARLLLPRLPDAILGRIFLLFPDPWPKRRHAPRRFVQWETLDSVARVLRPGGEFRIATDDVAYAAWILERLTGHAQFRWTASGPDDWRRPPDDWAPTRYEEKARQAGRAPVYLSFERRAA
jgi:tRNA (guanine-N7-)-methyltransferase